ncbi:hypothetical protein BDV96DRAFT_201918 [Lophiotrema nucula]|uniref:C2H2-type domain-containing protein n=1 Tax=Lophiotrema nucula TaxID=690887 RepID=A0A6A5YWD3_9PLEO|nr:hypothetical protein BDV96DRAFT_201918 [Lophiotrema nucula]
MRNEPRNQNTGNLQVREGSTREDNEGFAEDIKFAEGGRPSIHHSSTIESISEQMTGKSEVSPDATSLPPEPPIYAWLADTEAPKDPDSVLKWREAEEDRRAKRQEQNAQDLEVFRNVEIAFPLRDDVPICDAQDSAHLSHNAPDKPATGAYMLYRNILDQYPKLGDPLAWRFANKNWKRMENFQRKQRASPAPTPIQIEALDRRMSNPSESSDATSKDDDDAPYLHPFAPGSKPGEKRKICSLPPPPRLVPDHSSDSSYSAKCHLCHKTIHLRRKRDWSNHVMDDLLPYMCPIAECVAGDDMYARRRDLSAHIKLCHPLETCRQCHFCGKEANSDPIKHVGHHMEEIAFGVLSTSYEEWSYDDTDSEVSTISVRSASPPPRKKKEQRFFCTGFPPCQLSFTRSENLASHIRYVFRNSLNYILTDI